MQHTYRNMYMHVLSMHRMCMIVRILYRKCILFVVYVRIYTCIIMYILLLYIYTQYVYSIHATQHHATIRKQCINYTHKKDRNKQNITKHLLFLQLVWTCLNPVDMFESSCGMAPAPCLARPQRGDVSRWIQDGDCLRGNCMSDSASPAMKNHENDWTYWTFTIWSILKLPFESI